MKTLDIINSQKKRNELSTIAHRTQTEWKLFNPDWKLFKNNRNEWKYKIKKAKQNFTKKDCRSKIQKQFGDQFTEFLSQILKDALRYQHH